APAAIRDTHCLLTWTPAAPACAAPDYVALDLSCVERPTLTLHAECPVGESCVPTGKILAASEEMPTYHGACSEFAAKPGGTLPPKDPWDGGIIPRGYAGGCDACGIISGGNLFIANPYGPTTILVNVTPV